MKKLLFLFVVMSATIMAGHAQTQIDTTSQAIQLRADGILNKLKKDANLNDAQIQMIQPLVVQREKLRTQYALAEPKSEKRDGLALEIQKLTAEVYAGFSDEQKEVVKAKHDAFVKQRQAALKNKKNK